MAERKSSPCVSRPPQNVKLGIITSACSDGKEMYQKCTMHVQSCCFANLNLMILCRSHLIDVAVVGAIDRKINRPRR